VGGLDAFQRPQKLIDRAIRARREADSATEGFFQPESFARVCEVDPQSGYTIEKIKMVSPLPDLIEERFTDAINNSRNAFDQIIFAACEAIGKPIKDGHYPWSRNVGDLDNWKLRNKKSGAENIPKEFWQAIRGQEPYPRNSSNTMGDTLIRTMATFANRKHTVGVEVGCKVVGAVLGSFRGQAGNFSIPSLAWDPVRNEMEIARWTGQMQSSGEHQFAFYITFDATAPEEIRKIAASDAIGKFIDKAQVALDDLKACAKAHGAT